MSKATFVAFFLVVGGSLGAGALTGSGDSAVGALETVAPAFSSLVVDPAQAAAGETVTITFAVSEALDMVPSVLVNGNVADFVEETKAGNYSYAYLVPAEDPLGMATIEIAGQDLVGNPGALSDSSVLEIAEAAPSVPVRAWPVFLVLLAALALRRRKGAALLLVLFLLAAPMAAAQGPTVSNVAFVQQDNGAGGTEVVISYDLVSPNGPCDITVTLSKDGGTDGFPFAVTSVTGDLSGVSAGTDRSITWDIATDYPDEDIPNARIRVTADDGVDVDLPEMISVPAGTFTMGRLDTGTNDDTTYGTIDELPRHAVTLSAYEIGKYELTNQQAADVLNYALAAGNLMESDGVTPYTSGGDVYVNFGDPQMVLEVSSLYCQIEFSGGQFVVESRDGYSMADHPAVEVTWYGAVMYCNALSEIMGLGLVYDPTGTWAADFAENGYHLPTEAQWERAAAWDAGASRHYCYGNGSDSISCATANYYNGSAYCNPLGLSSYPYTSPVGYYDGTNGTVDSPSPAGCYDMSGNVWEWCNDWWYRVYTSSPVTDPEGPGTGSYRVLRGGGWHDIGYLCRSAIRNNYSPSYAYSHLGFRLAR